MATKQQHASTSKATKTTSPPVTKGAPAAKSSGREVALRSERAGAITAPEDIDMEADAGAGMKHVDADSFAIPFLAILQKNSPQCDPDAGEYNPDAKPGMILNTVTGELFDGKEGIALVPCNFMRKFLRWAPREVGGGFKGEIPVDEVAKLRDQGLLIEVENRLYVPDDNGNVNPKKQDKVADTRVHYMLLLHPDTGVAEQCVLSLSSTQIKKSKQLMSILGKVVAKRSDGSSFTPPTFANVVRMQTVPESNEKGSWSGVTFSLEGVIRDADTYRMARGFSMIVEAGKATVNYDAAGRAGVGGEDDDAPTRGQDGPPDEDPPPPAGGRARPAAGRRAQNGW